MKTAAVSQETLEEISDYIFKETVLAMERAMATADLPSVTFHEPKMIAERVVEMLRNAPLTCSKCETRAALFASRRAGERAEQAKGQAKNDQGICRFGECTSKVIPGYKTCGSDHA